MAGTGWEWVPALLWSAWRELQPPALSCAAAGLSCTCDFAVACWCSRPFRKNSFIAPSRHFKYVKQLFVLGLELDLELMREREREMLFLCQNKKWVAIFLVQLELLRWDSRHSPRAVKVNMGLCVMGHDQDLQVEGRAPAVLVPG